MTRQRVVAFDADLATLDSLREAFGTWEIDVRAGSVPLLRPEGSPVADLFIVGAQDTISATLALCRKLRSLAGQAVTPILVLVQPEQSAIVTAMLKAGATGCLVLPVHAKELAASWLRVQRGNQPGRHTLGLNKAQNADRWRDEGGQG